MTHNPGVLTDGLLVIALLLALWGGWRQGAFASVLSTIGVVFGLICGAGLAPKIMGLTDSTALRFLLGLGTVVLLVGMGNLVGGLLGAGVRDNMRLKSAQRIDSTIGAVFQALATLIVAWLVAIPLATGGTSAVAQGVRQSHILGFVDNFTPSFMGQLPAKISAMLNESGLPPLISPFEDHVTREVEAPAIKVDNVALVEQLRPSVIHILGDAQQCRRRLMGSGFVAAPDMVITNAHVVAGTDTVHLDTALGVKEASVVFYAPAEDIAVLRSPGLDLPALPWAPEVASSGDDAIVMGFPASGPFEAAPARVRDKITINGPNIYASGRVDREAYTVRGSIRQGNSGGPMVDVNGNVLGVVFGAATDNTDTGYVLTAADVQGKIGDITKLVDPVNTQNCVAR